MFLKSEEGKQNKGQNSVHWIWWEGAHGEISKGNFNGAVVLERIIAGSEEGQVVVNAGNFQEVGPCWKPNDSVIAWSRAIFVGFQVYTVGHVDILGSRL